MGTEDWILKGSKLITNTRKQLFKIQSRDQSLKSTILRKQNKITKIILYMYIYIYIYIYVKFALKIGSFLQGNIGYKNEN